MNTSKARASSILLFLASFGCGSAPEGSPPAATFTAPSHADPREAAPEPPRPPKPSGPDLRNSVGDAIVARTSDVRDAAGLSRVLVDLENASRAKGRVTALEVEPGLAAIRAVYGDNPVERRARASEFSERMRKLSLSLQPPASVPEFVQRQRERPSRGESQ